jgi:hypothetical protein
LHFLPDFGTLYALRPAPNFDCLLESNVTKQPKKIKIINIGLTKSILITTAQGGSVLLQIEIRIHQIKISKYQNK